MIEKSGSHEKNQGNKNKIKQKVKTQKKKFFSVGNRFSNLRNASKDTGRMTGGKKMKEKKQEYRGGRHKKRREGKC